MSRAIQEVDCGRFSIGKVVMVERTARAVQVHHAHAGLEGRAKRYDLHLLDLALQRLHLRAQARMHACARGA